MRIQAVLICLLLAIAVADAGVTSADLIGQWTGGTLGHGDWRSFTFRADHSFDGTGGDAISAGKWKLHGNKLELILHYDYDPKPISSSSPREWALIESISKGRMRVRWYSWEYNKDVSPAPDVKPLPPEVWTKRR
jgi:hypothetical protein